MNDKPTRNGRNKTTFKRAEGPGLGKGPEQNWKNKFPANKGGTATVPSPCAFCDGEHWHDKCEKHQTLAARYTAARERNLCFKCLKKHGRGKCPRPSKYYQCRGDHPTALCRQTKQEERPIGSINPVTEHKRRADQATKEQNGEAASNQAQCKSVGGERSKVLLRTAEVTIFNPSDPKKSTTATVFIDDGSERSFIKTDIAKRLDLPILEREECYLTNFRERNPKRYTSNVVKLGFLGVNGDSYVCSLNEMEFMVKAMPIVALKAVDENQLRARKLKFPTQLQQTHIMLSMDVRHDLNIRDEMEKLPSGFTLSNSRLGRMISGAGEWEQPISPWAQVMFTSSIIGAVLTQQEEAPEYENGQEDQMRSFFGLNIIGMDDDNTQVDRDATRLLDSVSYPSNGITKYQHHRPEMPTQSCIYKKCNNPSTTTRVEQHTIGRAGNMCQPEHLKQSGECRDCPRMGRNQLEGKEGN